MNSIAIIIPAFNEGEVIKSSLKDIKNFCKQNNIKAELVVIDDGSSDNTGVLARKYANYVITHRHNCGLGASLATGIEFAKRHGFESLVTFDSDGQHDPRDIKKVITKLSEGYDVVIGSRFVGTYTDMPKGRKTLLLLSNLVTFLFFGVWTTDSQSGFRALSRHAIDSIEIKSNRMEVSSEFFGEIKRLGLKFGEIPIHIRYTKYSMKKGQSNSHGLGVLIKLIYKVFS